MQSKIFPFWLRLSFVVIVGILIGVWFSGEATRKLDEEFFQRTLRANQQHSTRLLSGLLVQSVFTGNKRETDVIIREYVSNWPEVSYVHVLDDEGLYFTEWKKKPISFGPDIRKYEENLTYGGESFGILSLYVDTGEYQQEVRKHVYSTRKQAAAILLSICMFLVFFVNYFGVGKLDEVKKEGSS